MREHSTTWVAISRQAIKHNIRQFKKILKPRTDLMAVVKSNAYGHGLVEVATLAQSAGVRWFGTVSLTEAIKLRQAGIRGRLLVLSFFDPARLEMAIKKNITLTVYNVSAAFTINRLAKKLHRIVPVHMKIDTGTTRLGILAADSLQTAKTISRLSNIRLEGIFSHLADAENPDQASSSKQLAIFNTVIHQLAQYGIHVPYPHIACSAATILNPGSRFSLARVGISLYGLWSIETKHKHLKALNLLPALSWYTRILQVKTVPAGTRVGYGGTYRTKRPAAIAILPIGYWDGFDRKLSNNGEVLIRGRRCPIRGRICMNLTMVEVTGLRNVRPGEKVTLIGTDGRLSISADDLAHRIGTINYEVVTRINPLIPRIIY